jgi:hypothetical protein
MAVTIGQEPPKVHRVLVSAEVTGDLDKSSYSGGKGMKSG